MKQVICMVLITFSFVSFAEKIEDPKELKEKRMIAGEYETLKKKVEKKTYLNSLRSKLQTSKTYSRL